MRKFSQRLLVFCLVMVCLILAAALASADVPAMTINGYTENVTLEFNEAPAIQVIAPEGATALIVDAERIGGDEPRDWHESYDRYRLTPCVEINGMRFYDSGTWRVTARYTTIEYDDFDEDMLNWTELASIDVTVNDYEDRLIEPVITLSSDTVAQGEWIDVTLDNFQNLDEWYWYELFRVNENEEEEDEWLYHVDVDLKKWQAESFAVSTLNLDPGTYRLWFRTEAVRYEDNGVDEVFTVTEAGALEDGISLSADITPVEVPVTIAMRAQGADRMRLFMTLDEDVYWTDHWDADGDCVFWPMQPERPGTYQLTLIAWYNGNEEGVVVGDPATLRVDYRELLAAPAFDGFPGILTDGDDLNITLRLDEHTERCYLELNYCPDDGDWVLLYQTNREPEDPTISLTLPATLFTQPGRYRLHVHTHAVGYESRTGDLSFIRADEVSDIVMLKVNGGTETVTLPSNGNAHIDIIAPGATAARMLVGNNWEYRNSPNDFSFDYSFGSGEYALVAQITTDNPLWNEEGFDWGSFRWETDVNWAACSNAVVVHANETEGRLPQPDVALESDSVSQDGWVRATVTGQGEWFWGQVRKLWRNENGDVDWNYIMDCGWDGADGFAFPAVSLEPGEYYLTVGTGAVGWEGNEASVPFTITVGGAVSDLALFFESDEALTSRNVTFYAYAKDADYMRVDITWDQDPGWRDQRDGGGQMNTWDWSCSQSGVYTFTLTAWKGEDRLVGASFALTVNAPGGTLSSPTVSGVPGVILQNTAINGSFTLDSNTESVGVQLWYLLDNGDWENLFDEWRMASNKRAKELIFDADLFDRIGTYSLELHATAQGYNGVHLGKQILVIDEDLDQCLTLTVNDSTEDIEDWVSHQWLHADLTLPEEATAMRILLSGNWQCFDARDRKSFDDNPGSGSYTIVAQASTDDPVWRQEGFDWDSFDWNEDVNWTMISNAINVTVLSYGPVDEPEVAMEKTEFTQGEMLTGSITPQGKDEWYWANVRREWNDEFGNYQWEDVAECAFDENCFSLPTVLVAPGDYVLIVGIDATGWDGREIRIPITVEASGVEPEAALYFTQETIETNQDITFFAHAPGAEWFDVEIVKVGDPNWNAHHDSGGEYNSFSWSTGDSGRYQFVLNGWKSVEGGQDRELVCTSSSILTVTAPNGYVGDMEFRGIPGSIQQNTAVLGSFKPAENDALYEIRLIYAPQDGDWFTVYVNYRSPDWGDEEYLTKLDFPAEFFDRTGFYLLEISASARGYDSSYLSKRILVSEPMQQGLTLTVNNGSVEDIYLHQNLPVTVTAPEGVTAMRLWSSSYDWWDCRTDITDSRVEWTWGFHQGGDETLQAQATKDASVTEWLNAHDGSMEGFDWSQVNWTLASDPVTVNVIYLGELDNPDVDFPDGTEVARGEDLLMTVSRVDNAYGFGVQVRRADDEDWHWLIDMEYEYSGNMTILLPTDTLESGNYMVHIDPRIYGWNGHSIGYPFTVTEGSGWTGEAAFRVTPAEIQTRETITYSIYAPGAEEVMICNEDMNNPWRQKWGENLVDHAMLNWAKTYHLLAYARYPGQEEWQQIGETAEVSVTAPNGAVEILSVNAPTRKMANESWTISLLCDFKGTDGSAECFLTKPYDDWEYHLEQVDSVAEGNNQRITFQVDANVLSVGPYYINGYAFPGAVGYELAILDGQSEGKLVEITDGTIEATLTASPNPAEIFDDVQLSLEAAGATAVAIFTEGFGSDRFYEMGDSLQEAITMWDQGEVFVYGLYTTAQINPDAEGFNWDDVQWEGMSNAITIVINPPSGELEELNVLLENDTVRRGEKLQLIIWNENPGLDVSYGAHLQPADSDPFDPGFTWFGPDGEDDHTIWIDTLEVPAGEYTLRVSANARGCLPMNTWLPVTVMEAEAGLQLSTREDAVTCDMQQVTGYAKGAVQMALDVTFKDSEWGDQHYDAEGDCLKAEVYTSDHPDTLQLTLTATYANGSTGTLQKEIGVTAPNGLLHPTIRLNSPWQPGRDLDFTVNVQIPDAQYVVYVQDPNADEPVFEQYVAPKTAEQQFHLSKNDYQFVAGNAYMIRVIASATGYDGNEASLLISNYASQTTLTLPSGLKTITKEAFAGVAAERIVVPAGVTKIESKAFTGCPNLIELVLPEGITSFAADALGTSGPVYVYGTAGSDLEAYAATVDHLIFIPIN